MKKFVLIGIIILASLLRLWKLGDVPPSMNADEIAIGYNAYSLLKTGKDEYGKSFPLLFQSFDDYKMPVYIYTVVPSVALFGLEDVSVRLPSAIFGILTVTLVYFLVLELFGSVPVAVIASFLLAISPWHLQFSRSAYEANGALFFAIGGMWTVLRAHKKQILFLPAGVLLALSMWTYHSSRVFIPLILLAYIVIYRKELKGKLVYSALGLALFVLITLPLVSLSISQDGLTRAKGVSALDNPGLLERSIAWHEEDNQYSLPFGNIIHNRRLNDVTVVLNGYFAHYDLRFWFMEFAQGKYRAPGMGLLYLWELPFLFWGLHSMLKKKLTGGLLILAWFLIAPIAAAPTHLLPHPVRTLIFLPTFQIFTAIGLWDFIEATKKKSLWTMAFRIVVSVVASIGIFYYFHQYYVHLPREFGEEWQYGHKEVVMAADARKDKYSEIIVSTSLDQPYIFFLYYLKYDPATYLASGGTISGKFDEERNAFDVYSFRSYMKSGEAPQDGVLYVGDTKEMLSGFQQVETIYDLKGRDLYLLYHLSEL